MRNSSKNIVIVVLVLMVVAVAGIYFYSRVGGNPLQPVNMPAGSSLADNDVQNFVRHDFPKIIVYTNAQKPEAHFAEIAPYTTTRGQENIEQVFIRSQWLKTAERIDMRFLTEPDVTPLANHYRLPQWQAKFRIAVDFGGGGSVRTENYDVALTVVPKDLNGEHTLGIERMTLTPAPQ